jgi:hypothetical protein
MEHSRARVIADLGDEEIQLWREVAHTLSAEYWDVAHGREPRFDLGGKCMRQAYCGQLDPAPDRSKGTE